jgi:hypothetical protein
MTSRLCKILTVFGAVALLAGCKLVVVSPQGGDVTSLSNTRNCAGGSLCEIDVKKQFSESFTAVAKPGYQFVRWQKGTDFLCGDSTSPTCAVTLSGNAAVDAAIVALFDIAYIMPIYKDVGVDTDGDGIFDRQDEDDDNDGVLDVDDDCPLVGPNLNGFGCPYPPITDTVNANGREWAQVDLFTNLTWNQIAAVCPPPTGACIDHGVLNGLTMTGWTWASLADVTALLNTSGVTPPLNADAPESRDTLGTGGNAAWAQPIFDLGFRPTQSVIGIPSSSFISLGGWVRTPVSSDPTETRAYGAGVKNGNPQNFDAISNGEKAEKYHSSGVLGAYFVR